MDGFKETTVTLEPSRDRELRELRTRLAEAEKTLAAIRGDDMGAGVVGSPSGRRVDEFENADRPYRALVEQMQEGAITLSGDGTVLYCNRCFASFVGMPREQILGQPVDRFLQGAQAAILASMVRGDDGAPCTAQFVLLGSGATDVPVDISLVELERGEESARIVCAVVTDLSANRVRSRELAESNARLGAEVDERRRVEDSLRLALEAAGMGNWELDLVTGEARRSARHDQIFGYDVPVTRWTLDDALWHFVPSDRDAVARAFREAAKKGSIRFERRIRRVGDDCIRWISVRATVFYEGARPTRIAGVVSDVTDQRAVEEQLRQSQKMEAVGQLTGGVAHDFNNLLLVIGGSLDMLSRRMPADDRTNRLFAAARSGVARGAKLNNQLLAFARRQDLHSEVVSVDGLLPTFEHLLERAVGESIRVAVHRTEDLWLCKTDANQLETAILNLAINARDAMPGGGELTLSTQQRSIAEDEAQRTGAIAGDYVVICVHDTGSGMPPEIVARVFEPFFTTKEVGKGTGLGLSQVYGFARQSGGFVTIESEAGFGTAVRVHLPRTLQPLPAPVVERALDAMEHGKEVILLVEDDADVRATAAAMLRDLGYEIREADNGRRALELIDGGLSVDLVFSDVIMPHGMGGIELARELRNRPVSPRILLTSGYTAQRVIPHELTGQIRLLRKPYAQPELSQAIREAFGLPRVSTPGA